MPKTQPKPTRKTAAKKKTQRHPVTPIRAAKKHPKARRREPAHVKPPKKARPAMSDTPTTQPAEQRGHGENAGTLAVQTRSRNYNEPVESENGFKPGSETEYAEGDIDAGRIDPQELAQGQTAEMKSARDRRAYLLDQARKNEAANDELNAIQVEQNKRVQFGQNLIQDPDVMREESMVTARAELEAHDPDKVRETQAAAQKERDRKNKDAAKK